ncbi:hypothetical protein Tco_1204693 [Tanacetum coccineum]
MDTEEVSDRFVAPCFVNGLEAYDGEINLGVEENMISNEYVAKLCLEHKVKRGNKVVKKELIDELRGEIYFVKFIINLEEDDVEPGEERPIIKTMAYHDKYKKILNEVCKDKVELDGKIVKEEEEAVKRIKGEALKEKDDPGAFIFPIDWRDREEMKKVDRGITMINHTQAEAMGILTNVPWILRMIGGIVNTPERLFSMFDRFCHQTFHAARSDVMRNAKSDSDDEEEYQIKRKKFGAPIYRPKPVPYLDCNNPAEDAKSRYNTRSTQLLPRHIYSPCMVNWDVLNQMGCDGEIDDMLRIRLREARSDEEMLGLYQAVELEEEGLNVYFEGGLRSDKHFNAQDYWLSISREENLGLSRSHTSTIKKPILRVIHKMITYGLCQRMTGYDKVQKNDLWLLSMFDARHQNGYANVAWLIARWMKRKGAGTQKESQICYGQFISKIARKCRVLTENVVRSLSAPIYCRDLDTITLRDLIDSEGNLIPEDPQPGVPRVGIPRSPRASM